MNLRVCETPVRLFNKQTGRFDFVRCGKCNTCLNIRQSSFVQRMEEESKCWRYTVFFTLTFDDKNIPHFVLADNNRFLSDPHTGLCIDLDDLQGYDPKLSPVARRLYVCRRRFIPYVTVKHGQDFIKRLRYYFNSLLKNTHDKKILRYVLVSEYGPSTYRPHLHGILYFDSEVAAKSIEDLIFKAWSFGRVDCSFVKSSASSYVARYVSCTTGLPRVYLHKQIRPFMLSSKCPAIGTLLATSQELYQIFINGSVQRTIQDNKSMSFKDVPLWRSFESRLFPKIQSFNVLSHRDRVTLYSVYSQSCCESFEDFLTWCSNQVRCHVGYPYVHTVVSSYLLSLIDQNTNSTHPDRYYNLRNLFYLSRHVIHQARVFGVSLEFYVERIENYYSRKELFKLRNFYLFQSEISHKHVDPLTLLFLYDNYNDYISDPGSLKSFDSIDLGLFSFQLSNAYDIFKVLCDAQNSFNAKIQRDSLKSKKKNDYLDWISNHSVYKHKLNFNFYRDYA